MAEPAYIAQLDRHYNSRYLKDVVNGDAFEPILLRGGKARPNTFREVMESVTGFERYEKKAGGAGWVIEWEDWNSRTAGKQKWPASICVETEGDFLALIRKEKEAARFKTQVTALLEWKPALRSWLVERTNQVLELAPAWKGICAVVDYLLANKVGEHYIRSLPVPVHTKFIEQYKGTILSIIRHLDARRCTDNAKDLETALNFKSKPVLFPVRWLDKQLQERIFPGMEVIGLSPESLCLLDWPVVEVWLVENETTLYMLPVRPNAIAICTKGYALVELGIVPLLQKTILYYWGDMDEDGYAILSIGKSKYPHLRSVLMDEACFHFHQSEADVQPKAYKKQIPAYLTETEAAAFSALKSMNGRIEREKLMLDYVMNEIQSVGV